MGLRNLVIFLGFTSVGLLGLPAQSDIAPYASEAELGKLIGQKTRLEGIYHRDAFNAPAIALSGRVYYLLENPPTKHSFKFPVESSPASVEGVLYLYDGSIQFNELYNRIGSRYYFFSLDDAKIDFGNPLRGRNEQSDIVPGARSSIAPGL